ncbi:DUF3800 domain-containing protein [Methyloversatilis sp. NSM2]|uniref:DUF3800 domain-containing protein n=1 Tax=Methyloversatilis sp. NSM2 TaxID=3134135 RepID=UPI003116F12D
MYLLYCDESNLEEKDNDFFVYGGLAVEANAAVALSAAVEKIREDAGIAPDFVLKFNPGPKHLTHQEFSAVKQAVIQAAVQHKAIFLASLILHNVATSPDEARRNAINTICFHFDCLLSRPKSHGLVLIDRFEDKKIDGHLREKFSVGLTGLPYSEKMRLNRIIGFHYSAIGQSHFGSVIDIVLGSFRFAVNAHTRQEQGKLPTAKTMLDLIAPLFFSENPKGLISEISLCFSPKVIKAAKYRTRYEQLKAFLSENAIVAEQSIVGERLF